MKYIYTIAPTAFGVMGGYCLANGMWPLVAAGIGTGLVWGVICYRAGHSEARKVTAAIFRHIPSMTDWEEMR